MNRKRQIDRKIERESGGRRGGEKEHVGKNIFNFMMFLRRLPKPEGRGPVKTRGAQLF